MYGMNMRDAGILLAGYQEKKDVLIFQNVIQKGEKMAINGEIENELIRQYRKYSQAKMMECMEDAKKIYNDKFGDSEEQAICVSMIAVALFESRISPFHYWKQKKMKEIV